MKMFVQCDTPNGLQLTDEEKAAKNFLLRGSIEADHSRVDENSNDMEPSLPDWYDHAKYKRGQEYFAKNRPSILSSNMMGLLCLLLPDKGLQVLISTGRSGTAETARRRYVSTVLHTIAWYEQDLVPGSESWTSLAKVRRMHYHASKSAEKKQIGFISQNEMAATQFGFMGLALVRPHMFSIQDDNEEDIESFVYFWAVIGHMLGIQDKFNLCLQPVKVVKIVCLAYLRYIFVPALQLEPPNFKVMTKALLDGLNEFVPQISYEFQMFLVRKVASVPGYQHNVDRERETLCRSIYSQDEVEQLLRMFHGIKQNYMEFSFFHKIPIYNFNENNINDLAEDIVVENGNRRPMEIGFSTRLRKYLDLDDSISISLTLIDYETEWKSCLSDSKFYEMDRKTQMALSFSYMVKKFSETIIGRLMGGWFLSWVLWRFRRFLGKA